MEFKDAAHDNYSVVENRAKRAALHLDPHTVLRKADEAFSQSPTSSPRSATQSPVTPSLERRPSSTSTASDSKESDSQRDPSSGPQRARSSSVSGGKGDKEKRKRSRVTPDQLVHLERFFSVDRSPTAARRREISELLGMQERQTQIWFQNRRAKAKLQDGKNKGRGASAETPPDTPPELSTGFEVELHNLIHEDEPVTIIPCTDLSVGTWRRIATTVGKHDLVAYVCDAKRCLTWFIHSAGYGFKMEIPFDIILDTEFTNAAPGSGLASFALSQPPIFYLENISSPRTDGTVVRHWKRCADWTEGQQATKVLRHDLIGSAVQLAHVLRNLHANSPGSDIQLHSPSYNAPSPSPMELPPPPMAGLAGFNYRNDMANTADRNRRRSYSGPTMISHAHGGGGLPSACLNSHTNAVNVSSSITYPSSFPPHIRPHPTQAPAHLASPVFTDFSGSEPQHGLSHPQPSVGNYGSSAPHGIAPRSYSTQPTTRSYYGDESRLVSPYPIDRRHSSSSTFSHQSFDSPSPPLLTAPLHPSLHPNDNLTNGRSPGIITASGLPGMPYEQDEDLHRRDDMS